MEEKEKTQGQRRSYLCVPLLHGGRGGERERQRDRDRDEGQGKKKGEEGGREKRKATEDKLQYPGNQRQQQ